MDLVPQFLAVTAVLGLLGGTLWWLRRHGFASIVPAGRSSARRLERVEMLRLSPQHSLHLIRLGKTALIVASSPAGCSLVKSVPYGEIEGQG